MPVFRTRESCAIWNGLMRKSTAPRFMARHGFGDAAEAGHHDREDVGVARERRVEHFHAVGIGQAEVDDQGVVGEVLEALDGVGGVGRLGDLEPVGAQRLGDELSQIGFVVDDQDGGLGGAGHGMRTCLCARNQPTAGAGSSPHGATPAFLT